MVVEDSSCLDTHAIILKGTTVLTYKPRLLDRPFSGSLAGIEVTSPLSSSAHTLNVIVLLTWFWLQPVLSCQGFNCSPESCCQFQSFFEISGNVGLK